MRSARPVLGAAAVGCLLALAGCSADAGESGSMAEWEERHRQRVANLDRELTEVDAALDEGDRDAILDTCNLLTDASTDVRDDALPLPDQAADEALRTALDDIDAAAERCLAGVRSGAAADVEAAMDLVEDAQKSFERARAALEP